MSLLNLIQEGGFIMIPLLLCSVIIWAIVIEKIWFLGHFNKQYKLLISKAGDLINDGKFNEAKGLCHNTHPLISEPFLIMFDKRGSLDDWEDRIGRRLSETQHGLRRFLWILGTIGSSAPFIGLFGTVVGIIKSFQAMAVTGKSGFQVVAGGLSEALIATAAGIVVAVMAVFCYNFFQTKLIKVNLQFKNSLEDLMDQLKDNRGD
jgi:biopolymer transport protein ExbB